MLVLYLLNRQIRAVEGGFQKNGSMQVNGFWSAADGANCIANGVVTDEEAFEKLIRSFWEKNQLPRKEVYLVLGGTRFTNKMTEVPLQSRAKMLEFVSREFSDVDRITDPVYSYLPLPGEKNSSGSVRSMYAMAAPREYLLKYREIFRRLGITLCGIEPDMGSFYRLLGALSMLKDYTGILQMIDDAAIINVLLVKGERVYSGRNRLYSDPESTGYPVEAARAVSTILQFVRAQDIQEEIRHVYVTGLTEDALAVYGDSIEQIDPELVYEKLDVSADVAVQGGDRENLQDTGMLLALGALFNTDLKVNMVRQLSRDPQKRASMRRWKRTLIPLGAAALVMFAAAAFLGGRHISLSSRLDSVREYNSDPSVTETVERYDRANGEIFALKGLQENIQKLSGRIGSYPKVDSSVETVLEQCADGLVRARISGYDSFTGVLNFNAEADNVEQIHEFAALLEKQEIFSAVDYMGYEQDAEGIWHVRASCTMAGGQEEEYDAEDDGER